MDPRIALIAAEMERHLAESATVGELAGRVNLGSSQFRALFRAHMGRSPVQYQRWLRLQHARWMLERTFLSVKEVRRLVGYADATQFARDFRREHGRTPTQFRGRGLGPIGLVGPTPGPEPPVVPEKSTDRHAILQITRTKL